MHGIGILNAMQHPDPAAQSAPVRSIAVLRPNRRLGNALLLSPLLQALEARFPQARIELISGCGAAGTLFRGFSQVERAFIFSSAQLWGTLGTLVALKRRSYDLAIDPVVRSRSGRFLLSYVRARDRLGFSWGKPAHDRMLTHGVDPRPAPPHMALTPLYLLRSAYGGGAAPDGAAELPLDLRLTDSERRAGERRLAEMLGAPDRQHPWLGIYAHATGAKGYPIGWWHEVIASLRRQCGSARLVEFIPVDRRARLADLMPGLYTSDLRLLAATLAATSLVVIPDGGVMHLAEAAGAPVLGLFQATEPAYYGPYGARSQSLWTRDFSAEAVAARIGAMLGQDVPGPGCARGGVG
jgi:ADP-heptose:LPS heptosyltransferase